MSDAVNLIFPHQLVKESQLIDNRNKVYLIEEYLFFNQYQFHKQKIAFHRASMKYYESYLKKKKIDLEYVEAKDKNADIRALLKKLIKDGIKEVFIIDPTDDWLLRRIKNFNKNLKINVLESSQFLNKKNELTSFFDASKSFHFQTKFYKSERQNRKVLLDHKQEPVGGQWSFDKENRKKYPKSKTPPIIEWPKESNHWNKAVEYVNTNFKQNPGELTSKRSYPITHEEANSWLDDFLKNRFKEFGHY